MITLKTLPQASPQEVFDQVAQHLLQQMEQSKEDGTCSYRGDKGMKCAAGCLIADDEYEPYMEGEAWNSLFHDGIVPYDHLDLICDLQNLHDEVDPQYWGRNLKSLAQENGLEWRFDN